MNPSLNVPQSQFLAMPEKYRAFVGGFGSGKTWVGCAALCKHSWERPRISAGYFAPSFPQIRDIFYPTIEEVAHDWGLKVKIKQGNKEVDVYSGRDYRNTIICRSMNEPQTIVGFKIGHAMVDELDVMPTHKAEQAWRKIIARMRYKVDGLKNGVDVTTTPEGFKFTYQQFVKEVREKPRLAGLYGLIQASTYDNELNLPDDYIPSLFESYPKQLISAYLRGLFVNLTSGSIYPDFDRVLNNSFESVQESEPVLVGMDFNRLKMSAVVYVLRDGWPIAVDEVTDGRDTPYMAKLLKERYQAKGNAVTIVPDASGANSSSKNASESDISILRDAGLTVSVNASNPAVADRINAVNALICNGDGIRRLKVNVLRCPKLTESLEQQIYDNNGEPDKKSGLDHLNDAAGYPIAKQWPIVKKVAQVLKFKM